MPAFILSVILCIYFFPVIFGNDVFFYGDTFTIFYPFKKYFFQSLNEGIFPLWNPHIHSGYPMFADISLGIYYLPNYLFAFMQNMKGVSLIIVLHFGIAAIFMYLLARSLHFSKTGALVTSIIYTLSGMMVNYIVEAPRLMVVSLYPLFFLSLVKLFRKGKSLWIVITGLVLSLQIFAGHIQYVYIELFVSPFFLFLQKNKGSITHRLTLFILAVLSGVLFSAIALLPSFEFLPLTTRADIYKDISIQKNLSLSPLTLIRFVIAQFWGVRNQGSAWGTMNTGSIGYIGFLPLILILLYLKNLLKNKDVFIFLLISLISLLISFGVYLPFFNIFVSFIPLFRIFRNPMVFLALYTFFMAITSGYAFEMFTNDKKRRPKFTTFFFFLFILSVILYFLVTFKQYLPYSFLTWLAKIIHKNLSSFHNIEVDLIIAKLILANLAILGIFGFIAFLTRSKKLLVILVFVDLLLFTKGDLFTIDKGWINDQNPTALFLKQNIGSFRFLSSSEAVPFSGLNNYYSNLAFQPPFSKEGKHYDQKSLNEQFGHEVDLLSPDLGTLYGLPTVNGYTTFIIKNYNDLFSRENTVNELYKKASKFNPLILEKKTDATIGKIDFSFISFNDELFDRLAIKYIVTDRNLNLLHHKPVVSFGNVTIYENMQAQTRAVVLDQRGEIIDMPEITHENANLLELNVGKRGRLVVRDIYYPGWKAYIDGKEVTIEPFENIFRSIMVDKEKSVITFKFQPSSFYYGAWISGLSLTLTILYLIGIYVKKKLLR